MGHTKFNISDQCVAALKNGDEAAFKKIFKICYAPLCNFAARYVKSSRDCEDIVQEVFVTVWQKREDIKLNRSFRSYLYQCVRNKALDKLKHDEVVRRYNPLLARIHNERKENEKSELKDHRFYKETQEAIDKLPERARKVYKLHRKDGFTYKEIAFILDISPKTVESQMSRALKKLRDWLSEYLSHNQRQAK